MTRLLDWHSKWPVQSWVLVPIRQMPSPNVKHGRTGLCIPTGRKYQKTGRRSWFLQRCEEVTSYLSTWVSIERVEILIPFHDLLRILQVIKDFSCFLRTKEKRRLCRVDTRAMSRKVVIVRLLRSWTHMNDHDDDDDKVQSRWWTWLILWWYQLG